MSTHRDAGEHGPFVVAGLGSALLSALVLLPGAGPTRFVCRPIRNQARTWLEGESREPTRNFLAFCAALDHIEDDGLAWRKVERPASWGTDSTIVDGESASELADLVGGKVLEEVGSIALQRANLTASQKKAYWLPRGCEVDWAIGSRAIVFASESQES